MIYLVDKWKITLANLARKRGDGIYIERGKTGTSERFELFSLKATTPLRNPRNMDASELFITSWVFDPNSM